MFIAMLAHTGTMGRRVTQIEVGTAVGKSLGKMMPGPTVSRHFNGRVPDIRTLSAYAEEMGVDPGWLAFGDASRAPPPDVPAELLAHPAGKGRRKKKRGRA
jgi:hypothetical protein